ncbi:sodium-independent sulfate anion transporter-like [Hetaerina americana]|uniref:sodium-independent sulfate anion transporter-like n=1 Tax=Hetaerina americana TaxID=62018 RepID=UPI003A7F4F36
MLKSEVRRASSDLTLSSYLEDPAGDSPSPSPYPPRLSNGKEGKAAECNGGGGGGGGSGGGGKDNGADGVGPLHSVVVAWAKGKARKFFSMKTLRRRLPVSAWLPEYSRADAVGDLVAGVTVGLTVIPQSLAYSSVAGLPPQYGLYGSFLGCFVYILFGSCKDVPMGPTAIVSLLTYQTVNGMGPQYAILLCFLAGCVELLMGILGLGFLIDFVSGPVASGFTSAVALVIVTSQVKDVLGISASGSTFTEMWSSVINSISETRMWDTLLGSTCIIVLLLMRLLTMVEIGPKDEEKRSTFHNLVNKTLWLVATARNAILVLVCGFLGYWFALRGEPPFRLIGDIPPGLPTFQSPPFSAMKPDNTTAGFLEIVSKCGSGLLVLPLLSLLEDIAICKAFSSGKSVDATQEMIAIGLCNIANSFVQGYPGSGALSRSAVNNCSGVRTPMGGLYTGLLVVVALVFFTPYFYYIPKASLAGIIIAAVVFMVEVKVVRPMWRTKKSDLIPGIGTFISCLALRIEMGILVGIAINVLFILYQAARPKIEVEKLATRKGVDYLMVTPDRCLIFPSTDYVRNLVTKHGFKQAIPVVIDCSHIYGADFTAAGVVLNLTEDFIKRDQPLLFFNLKPGVVEVFEGLQPKGLVVYYSEDDLDTILKERFGVATV